MQIKRSASANNCYIVLLLYLLNPKKFAGEEHVTCKGVNTCLYTPYSKKLLL